MKGKIRGKDITGNVYGRLTAIELSYRDKKSNSFWLCKCECGNDTTVRIGDLGSGNTTSCGCYREEQSNKALIERSTTHGGHGTRLYDIWHSMKQRCYYKKHIGYESYGGRGIKVCQEWKNDFSNFRDWANSSGYSKSLSIDRVDNDGNYEPNNCKWSTVKEQSNNRRSNRFLSHKGETKTLSEWADVLDINDNTLSMRLNSGWSVERTLEEPVRGYKNAT